MAFFRFLQKEEKNFVQFRYLDALNNDAVELEEKIKRINNKAAALKIHQPLDDLDVSMSIQNIET